MPPKRSDSRRTQATLIATAEQLFAERGIEAVSLSEINRVAGQRNKSALHYHFGSRDGLLKAILTKHRKYLDPRRAELIAEYRRDGELTLHDAVSVMVRPLAELLEGDDPSGIHYIRIMAQLTSIPHHPINDWLFNDRPPSFDEIGPVIYRNIPRVPTALRVRRSLLMNGTMFHALLLMTLAEGDAAARARELYTADLIDCICALLSAPESEASSAVFDRAERTGLAPRAADDVIPHLGPT